MDLLQTLCLWTMWKMTSIFTQTLWKNTFKLKWHVHSSSSKWLSNLTLVLWHLIALWHIFCVSMAYLLRYYFTCSLRVWQGLHFIPHQPCYLQGMSASCIDSYLSITSIHVPLIFNHALLWDCTQIHIDIYMNRVINSSVLCMFYDSLYLYDLPVLSILLYFVSVSLVLLEWRASYDKS